MSKTLVTKAALVEKAARSVDETKVGITLYRSCKTDLKFNGSIKQRFSDFIVREVAKDGSVVRLTSLPPKKKIPWKSRPVVLLCKQFLAPLVSVQKPLAPGTKQPWHPAVCYMKTKLLEMSKAGSAAITNQKKILNTKRLIVALRSDVTSEDIMKLEAFIKDSDAKSFSLFHTDKSVRQRIHESIRNIAGDFLTSSGLANGEILITNSGCTKNDRKRKFNSSERQKFVNFVMYKSNEDSANASRRIGQRLHIVGKHRRVEIAGTKDKRGITSQLCQVPYMPLEKLGGINAGSTPDDCYASNITVGNAYETNEQLMMGDLQGNEFSAVIRNVVTPGVVVEEQVIKESWEHLKSHGFINYFGLQRFGTSSIPTHDIGRAMLQKNYKLAVDLILRPRTGDQSRTATARSNYATSKDVEKALREFPSFLVAENAVLKSLLRNKTDFRLALSKIPRRLRMMYAHAYQSFVWNSATSHRLEKLGMKPVVGDLIITTGVSSLYHNSSSSKKDSTKKQKTEDLKVRCLTQEDIDAGTFSLEDIVLPLPGRDSKYPLHESAEFYKDLLQFDASLEVENFGEGNVVDLNLVGGYRPLIAKAKSMSYTLKRYDDYTIPLMPTDLDIMCRKKEVESVENGKFLAICCTFQLPSSTYATMFFRELMKSSSNVLNQMSYNN